MPVAVRYGWSNYPWSTSGTKRICPPPPFRTDDFPLTTGTEKSNESTSAAAAASEDGYYPVIYKRRASAMNTMQPLRAFVLLGGAVLCSGERFYLWRRSQRPQPKTLQPGVRGVATRGFRPG